MKSYQRQILQTEQNMGLVQVPLDFVVGTSTMGRTYSFAANFMPIQKRLEEAGLLHIGPMLGNYYYVFNVKADPFTNPDVRKAFSMVINRANIVNNIVRGGKEAAYAFVPYGMLESNGREDFREAGSYLGL